MITAIDTNILLDIIIPNDRFAERAVEALQQASSVGSLVICDCVYAEVSVQFHSQDRCDALLEEVGIRVEALTREALFLASRAYRRYRQQGGKRSRVLPDFVVGAHAAVQASRLLSRDKEFYRSAFENLQVVDPGRFT